MAHLTVAQYDAIEAAIRDGRKVVVRRRRQDVVVVPERFAIRNRREAIEARHPTTGDPLILFIDEAESIEVVK
jgi:AmiR/NasT family two-component response regulator